MLYMYMWRRRVQVWRESRGSVHTHTHTHLEAHLELALTAVLTTLTPRKRALDDAVVDTRKVFCHCESAGTDA